MVLSYQGSDIFKGRYPYVVVHHKNAESSGSVGRDSAESPLHTIDIMLQL